MLFDARHEEWFFADHRRRGDGAYSLVVKRWDLVAATATDLVRALRTARRHEMEPEAVLIDLAPDDEYSPKESVVDGIHFELLDDGRLAVRIPLTSDRYVDEEAALFTETECLLGPLLRRHGATLVSVHADGYRSSTPYLHDAVVALPTRGRTLADLYEIGDSARMLHEAADAGAVTRRSVVGLVLGGRADLLVGQPEGPWLDVKSAHYDLGTAHGKVSLAQSVSRFCNAEVGGVVLVGMATKGVPGGEIIRAVKPVPLAAGLLRRYRQVLEGHLFPFPVGLQVQTVEMEPGQGLVLVAVPPQPEELKPFLVHGAIVDGRVEGAYISIVRRSGEDSVPITAQQIHSTLAAGRALLRRGTLPIHRETGEATT